ncbi:MAG: STAS domain-containing protein [Polyangiaceae bacterium]|nr:STAS domain-containing protein [Polyangiaceae bacterium]
MTAVSAMDTETAAHIGRMLAAVWLLGAEGIVVGVRPEVAQTMVGLGLDLSSVTTLANLREGLLHCMRASAPGRSGRQAAPSSR